MKAIFYSLLLLSSFSLLAQSSNQTDSGKKVEPHKQTKGGCNVSFHDTDVNAVLQNNT